MVLPKRAAPCLVLKLRYGHVLMTGAPSLAFLVISLKKVPNVALFMQGQ